MVNLRASLLTQIPQVLETVDAGLVTVAPAKVQRITSNNRKICDFNFIGNRLRAERAVAGPFIDALRARTGTAQVRGFVRARSVIGPGDSQASVALLRDLARLDRLTFC